MRCLVPELISQNLIKNKFKGYLKGAVLFADISGFTKMTKTLMEKGPEGAEVLSISINGLFGRCIDSVYINGGFVSTFGGDAFYAVFPESAGFCKRTVKAAEEIKRYFSERGEKKNRFGKFELSVKVAISYGGIEYRILKRDGIGAYYIKGKPFYDSAELSGSCGKNESLEDRKFKAISNKTRNSIKTSRAGVRIFTGEKNIDSMFYPKKVISLKTPGEFRETINCFISFDEDSFDNVLPSVVASVESHKGYLNRISFGDKGGFMLVVFGAPQSEGNDLDRALDMCVDFRGIEGFTFKAGVSSGMAYSGFIGSKNRCEYTAIGENVNLAARLMSKAKTGEIITDEKIREAKRSSHIFMSKGKTVLKGFNEPIEVFCLEKKIRSISEVSEFGKIIGRETEIMEIQRKLDAVLTEKSCQIIFLTGETGIGKTRIIEELYRKRGDFKWYLVNSVSTRKKSLGVFERFFRNVFDYEEGMTEQNRDKFFRIFREFKSSIKGKNEKEQFSRTESFIASILGIEIKNSLYENLDPKSRFQNIVWSVRVFFGKILDESKSALVFEDIEHLDPASEELVRLIVLDSAEKKCAIILSSTDEKIICLENVKTACEEKAVLHLKLEALDENKASELMDSNMAEINAVDNVRKYILNKSIGKPLFVINYCDYVKEKISKNPLYDPFLDDRMPSDLYSLTTSKIDALRQDVKTALEKAAIFGTEFSPGTLKFLLGVEFSEKVLKESINSRIIDVSDAHSFRFSDLVTYKVLYEMQSKTVLRRTHGKIADRLQDFFGIDIAPYFKDIAYHYEKAEKPEKAGEFYKKAAMRAAERFENADCVEYYGKILAYMKNRYTMKTKNKADKFLELTLKTERVLNLMAKRKQQKNVLGEAMKVLKYAGDILLKTQIIDKSGWGEMKDGEKMPPLEKFIEAYRIGKKYSNDKIQAESLHSLGCHMLNFGKVKTSEKFFKKALKIAEKNNFEKEIQKILTNLGGIYYMQMKFEKAIEMNRKSLRIARRENNKNMLLYSYEHLAVLYDVSGDFNRAEKYYIKSLKLAEETGNRNVLHSIFNNLSSHYYDLGEYEKSMCFCEKGLNVLKEINAPSEFAHAYNLMSQIHHYHFKDEDKAFEYIEKSLEVSRKFKDFITLVDTLEIKAGYLFDSGKLKESLRLTDEILSYEKRLGNFIEIIRANIKRPRIVFELSTDIKQKKECIELLEKLLPKTESDELKAELLFNLWKMSVKIHSHREKAEKYRDETIMIYVKISEKSPKFIYKRRLDELRIKNEVIN